MLNKKVVSILSSVAVILGLGFLIPADAQASAQAYWKFETDYNAGNAQGCLTAGKPSGGTGVVFMRSCISSDYQSWNFLTNNSDHYNLLVNKATGLCLTTENPPTSNGSAIVWTALCVPGSNYQAFEYSGDTYWFYNRPGLCLGAGSGTNVGAYHGDPRCATQWTGWVL